MKTILKSLLEGKTLAFADAETAAGLMLDGATPPELIGAALAAIQVRGETKAEIMGFLAAIERRATSIPLIGANAFDTCGTGGDGTGTFNISTATALCLAASGVNVAKHGNRSASSRSGSADVLEALQIPIDLSPGDVARSIEKNNFGFIYAPQYHPTFAAVGPIRKAMGTRTIFNLLGPLANPAPVKRRIVGLFDVKRLALIADVLRERGEEQAMVVASNDGMDEISLSCPTKVAHLKNGEISFYEITPETFGVESASLETLRGDNAAFNAQIIEKVLCGTLTGPCLDVVLINTAAALVVAGRVESFRDGVDVARKSIQSGNAHQTLKALKRKGHV